MITVDTILFALMLVTIINMVRYLTALRSLIYIMREAHPLLYQQVDGNVSLPRMVTSPSK